MPRAHRPPAEDSVAGLSLPLSEVQAQMQHMQHRGAFGESRRLSALLEYLVTQTIGGNAARLKEYVIATEALGRPASFDPRSSAAVRVEANRLRQRLQAYYAGAGRDDPIRIELRPGCYAPLFTRGGGTDAPTASAPDPHTLEAAAGPASAAFPSVFVLPLTYLGEVPRHRFLSRALDEELVATLSATGWLKIRANAAPLAGATPHGRIRRVPRDEGACYTLRGSVVSTGSQMRVFVQVIDSETGNLLLAHRLVQKIGDVLQDPGTAARTIAPHLVRTLSAAERLRATALDTDHLDAWSAYQLGNVHLYRFGRFDVQRAQECFRRSAAADSAFASPLGALAYAGFLDAVLGFDERRDRVVSDAIAAGRAAVSRDDGDPMAHFGLARALSLTGALEPAISELNAAVEIDPGFGPAHLGIGAALSLAGRHREAIAALDTALQLAPSDPILWTIENVRALSHLELGEFDEAIRYAEKACRHANTVPWAYLTLMSALSNMDRETEARSARHALLQRWPDFSLARFSGSNPFDRETTPRWHRGIGNTWELA